MRSINIKNYISYKLSFLLNFGRIARYNVLILVFQLTFLILLTRWSNFKVNVRNPACSAFKIGNILESICIDFLLKLTFCLTQANRTARVIYAWKCTLRNSDDFLNSPSLRYSWHLLVIRTKSNRGFGIRVGPSAIMIFEGVVTIIAWGYTSIIRVNRR